MTGAIAVLPVQRALQGRDAYSQEESTYSRTESCSWLPEMQTRRLCLRIILQDKNKRRKKTQKIKKIPPAVPEINGAMLTTNSNAVYTEILFLVELTPFATGTTGIPAASY